LFFKRNRCLIGAALTLLGFQGEGTPFSAWAPSHVGRAYKMLMRLNIRCHLPFFFSICTDQYLVNTYSVTEDLHFSFVLSVCTLAPCILKCRKDCRSCVCIFTNLEAQERYLSIIRGAPQSTLITGNVCSRLLLLLRNTPDPQYLPSYPCAQ